MINSKKVLVLIDTRNTHNFVDPYVARRSKLSMGKSQLTVKVANGDSLPCQDLCKAVAFQLQNLKTRANLYLLTFRGCDVDLGVDWLRNLGPILWNFVNLTMQFIFNDVLVQLQGLQPPAKFLEEQNHAPKLNKGSIKGIWLQMIGGELEKTSGNLDPSV